MAETQRQDEDAVELRLFLEETCCNLCRFLHVDGADTPPEAVKIDREVYMGVPGAFADIRVLPLGGRPFFVEVKFGYNPQRIIRSLARKYGPDAPGAKDAGKVILVVDAGRHADWSAIEAAIRSGLRPGLELEVWDETRLLTLLRERLNVSIQTLCASDLVQVRHAVTRAKAAYAFGPDATGDALESSLMWHFGYWRLRKLFSESGRTKRTLLRPGLYRDVVIVNADLTSFSSYVRDTRDDHVVRDCLTAFYSKSRYQVINAGGMLYQFIGDAVIGLFGIPEADPDNSHLRRALDCALSLVDIGDSVSAKWQRQIDRVQTGSGVHIGIAIGDLQIMSMHPFSRTHMGAIGDPINMTARLHRDTKTSEIVVSNSFYQQLDLDSQAGFDELDQFEARNVGTIRAWKASLERLRNQGH